MHSLQLIVTTAVVSVMLCVPLTIYLVFRVKTKGTAFKPIYERRNSMLADVEIKPYHELAPRLEGLGMRLIPGVCVQQIASVKKELNSKQFWDAQRDIDGRMVQFALVETQQLKPLAVVHIGGDGQPHQFPEHLMSGIKFCDELFQSIGIPEIVVCDEDMKQPQRVVERITEILKRREVGMVKV